MWIEERNGCLLAVERFRDDLTGKYVKVSTAIVKDSPAARRAAQKALQEKFDARSDGHSCLTLSKVGELYFAEAKDRLKPQTYVRDTAQYRHAVEAVGDVVVDKCKASYIKEKLKQTGNPNVTMNGYMKILKIVLRWAYQNEYIENIALIERMTKFPDQTLKEKVKDKFLESDELEALVEGMDREPWKLLTQFLALTGMRIGEAIALDNADVTDDRISITKTYVHLLQHTDSPKTRDSIRSIPIQAELKPIIARIKKHSAAMRLYNNTRNDIFFCSPAGGYVTYDVYEKYLRENGQRILDKKVSAHVLRHTFVSIYAEKGLDLDQISRHLGHSNSKITRDVYYHVTEKQKQMDAQRIDQIAIFAH